MSLRGLHAQLLLWTILPLIASLVVGAVAGVNAHQQSMRSLIAERDGALARVAATLWSEMLADRARDLQTTRFSSQSFDGGILVLDTRDARLGMVRAEPSAAAWEQRHERVAALLKAPRPAYSSPFFEGNRLVMLVAVNAPSLPEPSPPTPLPKGEGGGGATQSAKAFAPKTHEGGGVTVKVIPLSLTQGASPAFNVAMDTHSIDLKDDLVKTSILRDEKGTEYAPVAWDGAGPGGHHREGVLKFGALTGSPKQVTLVIKGVAGVAERVFTWELAD